MQLPWGKALHLNLGPLGDTEVRVEQFSLDILAQETGPGGRKVAIENQLAWTDHSHLGQLLTYAAGREAQIAIWVAPHFNDAHRAAINWLNQWTREPVEFYAVQVSAIKIDDSKPAPIFTPVAVPDGWPRQNQQTGTSVSDEERYLYRSFTDSLRRDLAERGVTESNTGIRGSHLYPQLAGKEAQVLLWLGHRKATDISHIFAALESERAEIAGELPEGEWRWDRRGNNQRYAWISLIKPEPFSINDPQEKLDETRKWLVDTRIRFKEVFNPRIQKILDEMDGEETEE